MGRPLSLSFGVEDLFEKGQELFREISPRRDATSDFQLQEQ